MQFIKPPQDSSQLPLEGLVTLKQVRAVYPVSKTTLYKEIKNGTFPRQRKKGKSSYWDVSEVRQFLKTLGANMLAD